jgi:hypothetical protein
MTNFADDCLDEITRVQLNMMDSYFISFDLKHDGQLFKDDRLADL